MSLTDVELDKLLEELLSDDFRHTDETWEPDPPDPMDLLVSAVNDALSGAAPLSPPLVGNSNPIQ